MYSIKIEPQQNYTITNWIHCTSLANILYTVHVTLQSTCTIALALINAVNKKFQQLTKYSLIIMLYIDMYVFVLTEKNFITHENPNI